MERSTRENLNSVGGVVFLFIRARGNIFSWYLGEVRKASAARVGSGVGGAALKSFFFVLKNQQLEIYRFFWGGGGSRIIVPHLFIVPFAFFLTYSLFM